MKVFISHKQEDESIARNVQRVLKLHGVISYLDVVDPAIGAYQQIGPDYIIAQIAKCTHIIPVISQETHKSWWVPFEIGVAVEKGRPVASYVVSSVQIPGYLRTWPCLRSDTDLARYALIASKQAYVTKLSESYQRTAPQRDVQTAARAFERELKSALGQ